MNADDLPEGEIVIERCWGDGFEAFIVLPVRHPMVGIQMLRHKIFEAGKSQMDAFLSEWPKEDPAYNKKGNIRVCGLFVQRIV